MPTQKSASAHDVNLPTALAFGRRAGVQLPADENIQLLGIEAQDVINFGDECTPAVAAAIPRVSQDVVQLRNDLPGGPPMISPEILAGTRTLPRSARRACARWP